ncbi:WYL domain-containing protein, partial [Pseudomonas aeruginosa]|nr:WYL domain-containing protein [Pseudomonas aeruginosa]
IEGIPQKQRDRLAFIEQQAWFCGAVSRRDVVSRFDIQTAAATRDLSLYRELAPENLFLDHREKVYRQSEGFNPIFTYSVSRITTWLSQGFGD